MGRPRRRGGPALVACSLSVAAAVLLGGCAGLEQSGTPAQRVSTWIRQGGGGSSIGNIEVDARNVDLALSRHDRPAAIREVCALLSNDAQRAIGNLPTPDRQLTDALDAAYTEAASAGDDCYKGAGGDAALLARSAAERRKLAALFDAAVRRAALVTGRTPTTDTTVPPTGGGDPFAGGQ